MALFLSQRDTESQERMDDPNCDLQELENTYRQFSIINALISQWYRIYKSEIRPFLHHNEPITMLDIGFGGGDIPIKIAQWAKDDGFDLHITAIDPDPRAFNYIQQLDRTQNVEFIQCGISDLDPEQQQFNFVISNHLIHHLSKEELPDFMSLAKKLSTTAVLFNDICRSDWAYLFFNIFARPIFRSSFITEDGLTSIKRSYTFDELLELTSTDWQVESLFPFRLLLKYYHA